MGFGSAAVNKAHRTGFRPGSHRSGTTPAHDWVNYPDHLSLFTERLMGVVLECRPALEMLAQHDRPETLFFLDPPYVLGTRYKGMASSCYTHEMSDEDHRAMAEAVKGLRGMVILSGYNCPLYEDLFGDWERIDRKSFADGARPRMESLWLNPAAGSVQGLPLGGAA